MLSKVICICFGFTFLRITYIVLHFLLIVHVAFLRYPDKQFILKNAAAKLKDNPYLGAKIFISDDVSKAVRDERKILKDRHPEEIRSREDVEYAFILGVFLRISFIKVTTQQN